MVLISLEIIDMEKLGSSCSLIIFRTHVSHRIIYTTSVSDRSLFLCPRGSRVLCFSYESVRLTASRPSACVPAVVRMRTFDCSDNVCTATQK